MSAALAIVLLALASALGGLVWLRAGQRQSLRERLLFGIAVEETPEAADLAAGDYGLRGRRRFAYHTARFLQTLPGRGLTLALGAGAGNVAALAGGLSAGQAAGAAAGAGVLSLLGVQLDNQFSDGGARVSTVTPGSAADEAGLEAGDVILRIDERSIDDATELVVTVRSYAPGDRIEVGFERNGQDREATLVLGDDSQAG